MRLVRFFSALLVLATVVVAKIPNKNCHCLDKSKSQQQECPFGKLRAAVSSLSVVGDFSPIAPIVATYETDELLQAVRRDLTIILPTRARDSPVVFALL